MSRNRSRSGVDANQEVSGPALPSVITLAAHAGLRRGCRCDRTYAPLRSRHTQTGRHDALPAHIGDLHFRHYGKFRRPFKLNNQTPEQPVRLMM